ncbi:conserved hypothetical protein [Treponema primitia ZAS-2]|uniref:Flagellar Assembly Protein A N-terminal region domain-containing protein n=1 Tax=Treponema primitia (strain ATCC BAA-887 / DSM 12427 / ZAS-2) TaxID=545694 RepID=F5YIF6_TREPZ|nr:FapA family protein [Treponema primitia]AEF85271.1 conserved hypothetical protein [Treponema primitia ZAS-2]
MDTNVLSAGKNDGKVNIRFSEEDLEAWADFTPPMGDGLPITNDYLIALMNKHNISYGVHWDTLKDTAFQCNLDKKPVKDVLIALGDPPIKEVNEYYELNPHLATSSTPVPDKNRNGQIDYRAYSPFVIVKKDQVLALKKPRIPGRDGKNVHGVAIPCSTSRTEGVSGGKHTVSTEKYILSEINGQLIENNKELNVFEDLTIKGSVGYATGNIIFPGDITINGTVADGFKIYSGGSVTIKQTLDATEVNTKGDLIVSGGIIGRGRGFLKVGGAMRTKFIQNCRAACRKTITVDSEINNSSIYTMETLEMGDKGRILGGEVYAIHGIKAGGIGKNAGKATRIHCGIDFTLQKDKENCNNTLRLLAEKLGKLRELMAVPESDPEKQTKMEELLHRLEDEQKKNTLQIGNLMGRINTDENAVVEVSGEIAPGTLIEICEIALFVAEPLKRVRIRLDKPGGKLVHEPF